MHGDHEDSGTGGGGRLDGQVYEIHVRGHLDERWSAWFDGLLVEHADDGTTTLRGHVEDQAALHGLLQKVRDLGLELISINRTRDGPPRARARHDDEGRQTANGNESK